MCKLRLKVQYVYRRFGSDLTSLCGELSEMTFGEEGTRIRRSLRAERRARPLTGLAGRQVP